MKPRESLLTRRNIILAILIALALYAVVALVLSLRKNDTPSNQEEFTPNLAFITNSDELGSSIDSTQYLLASEDLDTFANKALGSPRTSESYTNILSVEGKVKKSGDSVSFDGDFVKQKTKVHVTLKQLKNSRLTTSITSLKDNSNIDSQLPSNSKKNQFIATLPIVKGSYGFYYYADTKKISIEVSGSYTSAIKHTILEELRKSIGQNTLGEEDYDLYFAPAIQGGSSELIKDTNYTVQ